MNWKPRLRGEDIAPTCGRLACENDELIFWQSRMTMHGQRAELPELVNIRELAAKVREEVYHGR